MHSIMMVSLPADSVLPVCVKNTFIDLQEAHCDMARSLGRSKTMPSSMLPGPVSEAPTLDDDNDPAVTSDDDWSDGFYPSPCLSAQPSPTSWRSPSGAFFSCGFSHGHLDETPSEDVASPSICGSVLNPGANLWIPPCVPECLKPMQPSIMHSITIVPLPADASLPVCVKNTFIDLQEAHCDIARSSRRSKTMPSSMLPGPVSEASTFHDDDVQALTSDDDRSDGFYPSPCSSAQPSPTSLRFPSGAIITRGLGYGQLNETPSEDAAASSLCRSVLNPRANPWIPPCWSGFPMPPLPAIGSHQPTELQRRDQYEPFVDAIRCGVLELRIGVAGVDVFEEPIGYTVVLRMSRESIRLMDIVLNGAQEALLRAAEESEHVYIENFQTGPFLQTARGFSARLGTLALATGSACANEVEVNVIVWKVD